MGKWLKMCAFGPASEDQVYPQTGKPGPNRKARAGPRFLVLFCSIITLKFIMFLNISMFNYPIFTVMHMISV